MVFLEIFAWLWIARVRRKGQIELCLTDNTVRTMKLQRVSVAPSVSCTGEWVEDWLNSTSTSPGRWSGKGQSPLSLTPVHLQFPDASWTGTGVAIICCWYRPATNYCPEEPAGIGKRISEAWGLQDDSSGTIHLSGLCPEAQATLCRVHLKPPESREPLSHLPNFPLPFWSVISVDRCQLDYTWKSKPYWHVSWTSV